MTTSEPTPPQPNPRLINVTDEDGDLLQLHVLAKSPHVGVFCVQGGERSGVRLTVEQAKVVHNYLGLVIAELEAK